MNNGNKYLSPTNSAVGLAQFLNVRLTITDFTIKHKRMVHTYIKSEKPGIIGSQNPGIIKFEKPAIILNDLIKINQERIACYKQSIDRATILDIDLKHLFEEIIAEGELFKEQLFYKINDIDYDSKDDLRVSGMIHRAWLDLRINFTGNTRSALINFCEYNEDVAQHAYRAALNLSAGMNYDIYTLIEDQQSMLINTSASIKKCHRARHYSNPVMAYFN